MYLSESRGRWDRGRDGRAEWAFEGGPNAAGQVGEPEGTSVIKAGACQCALSGRVSVKPGGTAEGCISLLSQRMLGTEAIFIFPFCPGTQF